MTHLTFLLLAPLALAVVAGVGVLGWWRLRGPIRRALVTFAIAEGAWIVGATARLASASEPVMVRLTEFIYLSATLTVVGWLWFALLYARRWHGRARLLFGLYTAEGILFSGLVLTNRFHGLAWSEVAYRADGLFPTLTYTFGPATYVHFALAWTALAGSIVMVLRAYAKAGVPFRRVSRWIVASLLLPVAFSVAFVIWAEEAGADFTSLSLAFTSAAVALGLGRNALLDVKPLARTALVERLREGFVVLDTESRVADVNPAARALLGDPKTLLGQPKSLLGRHIGDVLTPEQRVAAEALWGRQQAQAELPFTIDGDPRIYDILLSPLEDAGRPAGRLLLLYDVTEQRAQQNALLQLNTQLKRQNAELDDFAHTVAHDLKTSIQHLVGHAELLYEDGPRLSEAEHRDLASGLVRAGIKLDSIVQELLLFATTRSGSISPAPLDMEAVFEEAIDRLRPTLDSTRASVTVATDWPEAMGYAPWVETVWYNYVSNAVKYGGHPAAITICSDPVDREGQIRFWVQDDGPGLSAADQGRLFLPFSRVSDTATGTEGTGLGLSIVQRIMERLGGACGVESAGVSGEGSRFWFSLPAVPARPDR